MPAGCNALHLYAGETWHSNRHLGGKLVALPEVARGVVPHSVDVVLFGEKEHVVGGAGRLLNLEVQSGHLSELEDFTGVALARDAELVLRVIARNEHVALMGDHSRAMLCAGDVPDSKLVQVKAVVAWSRGLVDIHSRIEACSSMRARTPRIQSTIAGHQRTVRATAFDLDWHESELAECSRVHLHGRSRKLYIWVTHAKLSALVTAKCKQLRNSVSWSR